MTNPGPKSLLNLKPSLAGRSQPRLTALIQAKILRLLVEDPCTVAELVQETEVHIQTIRSYLRALHEFKLVRRAGWVMDKGGRRTIPLWAWGPDKRDTAKPIYSSRERTQRYRANRRSRELNEAILGSSNLTHQQVENMP